MNWWVVLIIVVILGFIIGNILLLKQSAKFKFEKPKEQDKNDIQDKDDNS